MRTPQIRDNEGITLIENLVGVLLSCIFITALIATFYLSVSSVSYGRHIAAANALLRTYMDQEIAAGYNGGKIDIDDAINEGSYYSTMPKSTGGSRSEKIDDRDTTDTSDDIYATVTCDPWYPNNIRTVTGEDLKFIDPPSSGIKYKTIGFTVSWTEKTPAGQQEKTLSVRSAYNICDHT